MTEPRSGAALVLGERIKKSRLALRLTQSDVAHLAGMDVANYGKLERGLGNATLTTIVQVATVLEAAPGQWMAGLAGTDLLPPTRTRLYTATEFIEARREHSDRSSLRKPRTPARERRLR